MVIRLRLVVGSICFVWIYRDNDFSGKGISAILGLFYLTHRFFLSDSWRSAYETYAFFKRGVELHAFLVSWLYICKLQLCTRDYKDFCELLEPTGKRYDIQFFRMRQTTRYVLVFVHAKIGTCTFSVHSKVQLDTQNKEVLLIDNFDVILRIIKIEKSGGSSSLK